MTEREKIISLAKACKLHCGDFGVEAFYKAAQAEAYDQAIEFVRNKNYDNDPYILARKIEEMKAQS